MTWWTKPFCGFDIETTGVDVENDRVVTACFVRITPSEKPPWKVEATNWLINPGVPIPAGATQIHGITTERARDEGRHPTDALPEIYYRLQDAMTRGEPIAGMNLAFDLTLFDRDHSNHGGRSFETSVEFGPFVDVYVIDKEIDRFRRGKRTLDALCRHYNVRLDGAHDAAHDAIAACRLAWRLVTSSNVLMGMSAWELHEAQVGWRAEQQRSLREYFREHGKGEAAATVSEAWPILPR